MGNNNNKPDQQQQRRTRPLTTRLLSTGSLSKKVGKVAKSLQSACFMSAQQHVLQVLEECLNLIHDDPDFQLDLGQRQGAMSHLVKIMSKWEQDPVVQEKCCAILRDVCSVHRENRTKV